MTLSAAAEGHARKILAILKDWNLHPGECQMLKVIEKDFIDAGGRLEDCVEGFEYGVEKGWWNLSGFEAFLTEKGAAEMI